MRTLQNPLCLKNMLLELLSPNATGFLIPWLIVHYVQNLSKMQSIQIRSHRGKFPSGRCLRELSHLLTELLGMTGLKRKMGLEVKCMLKKCI